ncbi:MAG TPA: hypothetical protein VFU86_19425 [Terriglobales bacterium]|nr:hypothetical protein [Terriglobales bacterium]
MSKHRLTLFFVAIALLVGATLPAAAADEWRAVVPFDFVVQGVTYPAGNYDVIATTSPRVVVLRNQAHLKRSFLMVLPVGESLANGNARLPLALKAASPVKPSQRGSGQK